VSRHRADGYSVVIDTNVIVSGVFNPYGSPDRIVNALLSEAITARCTTIAFCRNIVKFKPRRGQHSVLVTTPADFDSIGGRPL
jgi:hypothetical protein